MLVDLDTHKLIGMAESRKQKDVLQVLEGWGAEVLRQIVEVSIDLSGNSKGLVNKVLPNADIVADRFHVMKLVNQELNAARNTVIKTAEENQDAAENEGVKKKLKVQQICIVKTRDKPDSKPANQIRESESNFSNTCQNASTKGSI